MEGIKERGKEGERKKDSNKRKKRNATIFLCLFLGMEF